MTLALWYQGARPQTLGASVAPVLVGTAIADLYGQVVWYRAGLCLVVGVALQVGVNYANDYSDGVKGIDRDRRGPARLTTSGLKAPGAVRRAAMVAVCVAGLAGIALALAVNPWLLAAGAASIAAAALYSGGPKPYASVGLGEAMVLVFFGFVATCGSAYVHLERVPWLAVLASLQVGLLACAILLANNVRDVESDRAAGKRTLAVRIGAPAAVGFFRASILLPSALVPVASTVAPGALVALAALPLSARPLRSVAPSADTATLVGGLLSTAKLQLAFAGLLAAGIAWS